MLSTSKQEKLLLALKAYYKKFFSSNMTELDESGTRIMINSFLHEVLGYTPIEEIKTEYMIKGTYADYVIQLKGTRHFLVEVKALSLSLSEGHLRQAVNYGANEGIEWALLTNGINFEIYKILFNKPIESVKVFSMDLGDQSQFKKHVDMLQYLHKDAVANKGLPMLWNITLALDAKNISGMLFGEPVISFLKKELKNKFDRKFSDEEIEGALVKVICEPIKIENVKPVRAKKVIKKKPEAPIIESTAPIIEPLDIAAKPLDTNVQSA